MNSSSNMNSVSNVNNNVDGDKNFIDKTRVESKMNDNEG